MRKKQPAAKPEPKHEDDDARDARGPFTDEQWEHLKVWVRRELRLRGWGVTSEEREEQNP